MYTRQFDSYFPYVPVVAQRCPHDLNGKSLAYWVMLFQNCTDVKYKWYIRHWPYWTPPHCFRLAAVCISTEHTVVVCLHLSYIVRWSQRVMTLQYVCGTWQRVGHWWLWPITRRASARWLFIRHCKFSLVNLSLVHPTLSQIWPGQYRKD